VNPEEAAAQTLDLAATPTGAFIKDGTVTDVTGNNATVNVDGGGQARPAILGFIPSAGDRVTMLFDPSANGTCVILGTLGGVSTIEEIYPVGSVVIFYDSESPADRYGVGTWEQIATGEALVGIGAAPFDAVGSVTEGEESVTLTESEMPGHVHAGPSHTHTGPSHTHTGPSHAHTGPTGSWFHYVGAGSGTRADGGAGGDDAYDRDTLGSTGSAGTGDTGASGTGSTGASGTADTASTGGDNPHNNIQPSFVIYVWRRTA